MAASGLPQSGRQWFATVGGYPTVGPPPVCYGWPTHDSVVGGPPPASHHGWASKGGAATGKPQSAHPLLCCRWPDTGKPPRVGIQRWRRHWQAIGGPPILCHWWPDTRLPPQVASDGGPPVAYSASAERFESRGGSKNIRKVLLSFGYLSFCLALPPRPLPPPFNALHPRAPSIHPARQVPSLLPCVIFVFLLYFIAQR